MEINDNVFLREMENLKHTERSLHTQKNIRVRTCPHDKLHKHFHHLRNDAKNKFFTQLKLKRLTTVPPQRILKIFVSCKSFQITQRVIDTVNR